ncbi:trimeric LpxA-like protein [Whalleya microplaca]|nr:trimeric LpxA-like protein [Whalleya microplaca]
MPATSKHDTLKRSKLVDYSAKENDLRFARSRCAEACFDFNSTYATAYASKSNRDHKYMEIISPGFSRRKPTETALVPDIKSPFTVEYGTGVTIHHTTSIDSGCKILDSFASNINVTIGKNCQIGTNVTIVSQQPPRRSSARDNRSHSTGASVTIGNSVYIGASATIGPGVTIGDGAFVDIGSVVFEDVAAYSEVRGNPAEVVRTDLNKAID